MNTLFIYHWLFRVVGPLFTGVAAYTLILMTYGDFDNLYESSNSKELYLCIGLSFIVQELTIFLFRRLSKSLFEDIHATKVILSASSVLVLGLIATSFGLSFYYQFFLGYLPAQEELILFNCIYALLLILYIIIYLSHGILAAMAENRINTQIKIKQESKENFTRFLKGINPELLTDSLESVISHLHANEDVADNIVTLLSSVYRYIISKRKHQLISINEEIEATQKLIELYNHLSYRKAAIKYIPSTGSIVPGTLLHIVEQILKTTISGKIPPLVFDIILKNDFIYINYLINDRLGLGFSKEDLVSYQKQYSFYTERTLNTSTMKMTRTISIPVLNISGQL